MALSVFPFLVLDVTSLAKKIFVLSLLSFNSLMNQKETLPEFLWLSSAFWGTASNCASPFLLFFFVLFGECTFLKLDQINTFSPLFSNVF